MLDESDSICLRCSLTAHSRPHIPEPLSVIITLLNTNHSPSNREALRGSLTSLRSHIRSAVNDISQLEGVIDSLRLEHKRLCEIEKTYQTVLHPIRAVSDEILAQIFHKCAGNDGMADLYQGHGQPLFDYDSLDTTKPPWTLSQVCQRWRAVALSDSALWSYVGVVFPDPELPFQRQVKMVNLLMLQMHRSQQRLLAVSIRSSFQVDGFHPLLVAVCSHSNRWENLRVWFGKNFPESLRCMSSIVKGNIPHLRKLHLQPGRSFAKLSIDSDVVIDGFQYAPSLQDLAIWGHTRRLVDILHVPWKQITRYRTCDLHLKVEQSFDYRALSRMPNLKIFHEQRSLGEHILQSPPPSLSSLHTLSFGISGNYSTLSSLLERLVLSNLRDLRIDATAKIEHLPQFLSRSSETLRVLKLRVKESESAVVVPLLECVPGVEHLAMRGNAPDALRTLAERVPSTGKLRLLPRLQRLGLWMLLGADEIDEDSLLSLAENRVRPGAEDESVTASHLPSETDVEDFSYLRTLELDIKFIIGTDTLQSLRSLEAKGLEVNRSACEWFFLSSEAEWA